MNYEQLPFYALTVELAMGVCKGGADLPYILKSKILHKNHHRLCWWVLGR